LHTFSRTLVQVERARQRAPQEEDGGRRRRRAVGPGSLHSAARGQGRPTEDDPVHADRRLPTLPSRYVHPLHVLPLVRLHSNTHRGVTGSKMWGGHAWQAHGSRAYNGVWGTAASGVQAKAPNPLLLSKNSLDLHQSQERPLAKVGWTCPPQSTPWRRP